MTSLADTNGSTFTYAFDGEGNRISQSLNDCLTTRFVYDGANAVLEVSAGGGSAYGGNASNQVIWAWVNAPGLDQPVERIAFINGTPRTRQVFHADGLGSIAALTDESGATVQTYTYAAFGSIRTQTGTDLNRITYTAREAMGDSLGFFYYRHRIYDPHTGRFTSEDPLGFVDGPNRYVYAGNSPAKWIDPLGLEFHNNSGVNAWVKPELGDDPELVPPGGIYDKPFDGFSTPLNPCQVFKTPDGTDVWLFDTFVATSGSLSDLLKSEGGYQFLLSLLGPMTRLWKEGWKGQEWINEYPDKPKTDWQKLMDKSCESK